MGAKGREEVSGTCPHSLGHGEPLNIFDQGSGLVRAMLFSEKCGRGVMANWGCRTPSTLDFLTE